MKTLAKYREVLTWLCIYLADKSVSKRQKVLHVSFSVLINASNFGALVGSIIIVIENSSVDIVKLSMAFLQIGGLSGEIYMMAVALVSHKKITAMFDSLSEICDTGEYF